MSHRRPPLVRAVQLNTAVLVVEIAAGIGFNSFSLIMDGVHNLSDEVALVLLVFLQPESGSFRQTFTLRQPVQLDRPAGHLRISCLARRRAPGIASASARHGPDRCRFNRCISQLGRCSSAS